MRLTKYEPSNKSMFPYQLKDEELSTELDSIHKLGQLEDIEEELGIDLITLFKAIRKGAWVSYKYEKQPPKHTNNLHLNHYDEWCLSNKGYDLPLSEYGKTWALTREELL